MDLRRSLVVMTTYSRVSHEVRSVARGFIQSCLEETTSDGDCTISLSSLLKCMTFLTEEKLLFTSGLKNLF